MKSASLDLLHQLLVALVILPEHLVEQLRPLLRLLLLNLTALLLHGTLGWVRLQVSRCVREVCLLTLEELRNAFLLGNLEVLKRHPRQVPSPLEAQR